MRFYRKSLKKILTKDMGRIVMVICPRTNEHHGTLFMQYLFWGFGYCIDEPSFEEVMDIVDDTGLGYEGWTIIEKPCYYCANHLPNGEPQRRPNGFETNSADPLPD
jgi:hypothetical protein